MRRPVIVESPYAGDIERNIRYARAAVRDCLARNESPFASHLLFTQEGVLRDECPSERAAGIEAGLIWHQFATLTAVYIDLGISAGMELGIVHSQGLGQSIEYRSVRGVW